MNKDRCKIEEGIYLFSKPVGPSSFQFLRSVQRKFGAKKAGHGGTLDPLAEGLMIIALDEGTKKLNNYVKLNKLYRAEIVLGESRTTGDREGEIIQEKAYRDSFSEKDIHFALSQLLGEREFPAPLYSAVKVQGKPLYAYARSGETPPNIPLKKSHLLSYEILGIFENKERERLSITLSLEVASGTYIRTLAEELGKILSYPAYMASLSRVKIGEFDISRACSLEEKKPVHL